MTEQLRERYLEALIARAATDAPDAVLDRIERLLGIDGAIQQPGSARVEAEVRDTLGSGEADLARDSASPLPPGSFVCSCGRAFDTQRGRSRHQFADRKQHTDVRPNGFDRQPLVVEVKADHPAHSERYLCGRCDEPFLSRLGRDEHQALAACARRPTRPPTSDEPFRIVATAPGSGQAMGMGE